MYYYHKRDEPLAKLPRFEHRVKPYLAWLHGQRITALEIESVRSTFVVRKGTCRIKFNHTTGGIDVERTLRISAVSVVGAGPDAILKGKRGSILESGANKRV